jgi:hypothetical protein
MKQRIRIFLLVFFATLSATGCRLPLEDLALDHEVYVSLKEGIPCFSIEDDATVLRKNVRIGEVYVGREFSNRKPEYWWVFNWKEVFSLPSGECIQYGKDAGRERRVLRADNCAFHGDTPITMLPSGECVAGGAARELQEDVAYFVNFHASVDKPEGLHGFSSFFCLTRGENGEKVIRKLKRNHATQEVESCR